MKKILIYLRKFGLPALMIGLLFYGAAYSKDIITGYREFFNPSTNSQQESQIATLQKVESDFKDWSNVDVFNRDEVLSKLNGAQGWTKMSERNMKLTQGVWTENSESDEAVEMIFKISNTSVALFNVDSVKAMYEYVSVNEEGKTITMIIRTKEVGK